MNKAKRIIACVLVVAMASITLAGCTTFDNFRKAFLNKNPDNDAQIIVGVYEPMTGTDKAAGEAEVRGIELAHQLYPEVGGARVELIYADNKSDLHAADTAITDLLKKKPTAVLGSYGNIYSMVAGEYLKEAKIPAIAITNTNPLVTKNNPYYFRVSLVDTYQSTAMARYVIEVLQQPQAGVLIPADNEQALAQASAFETHMNAAAGEGAIAVYKTYAAGSGEYREQLEAIKASGVKSVYLGGDIEDVTGVLKDAKALGMTDVIFLGDSTWAEEESAKKIRKYANNNVAFTTLYTDEALITEASQEFRKAYQDAYGEEPTAATALGFDSYMILLNALAHAGAGCSGEELKDALLGTENFQGASGIITFDNYGDPEKSVVINTFKNKSITPLCTIAPAAEVIPLVTQPDEASEE